MTDVMATTNRLYSTQTMSYYYSSNQGQLQREVERENEQIAVLRKECPSFFDEDQRNKRESATFSRKNQLIVPANVSYMHSHKFLNSPMQKRGTTLPHRDRDSASFKQYLQGKSPSKHPLKIVTHEVQGITRDKKNPDATHRGITY